MTVALTFDSFNANDAVHYGVTKATPLDTPPIDATIIPLGGRPGGVLAHQQDGPRTITIEGWIVGDDLDDAIARRDILVNVYSRPGKRLVAGPDGRGWIATLVGKVQVTWDTSGLRHFLYTATFLAPLPYALAILPTVATEDEPGMTVYADIDVAGVSQYASIVGGQGPQLYLRLGDPVGATIAMDSSPSGLTAYAVGGVTFGVAGSLTNDADTAVTLNGTTGYLWALGGALVVGDTFTFRLRVKRVGVGSAQTLIHLAPVLAAYTAPVLGFDATNHLVLQAVDQTGAVTTTIATTTATYASTVVWYDIVVKKSGATVLFYVDGALSATGAVTNATMTSAGVASATAYIGVKSANTQFLSASIDEVFIGATALVGTQVADAYQAANGVEFMRYGIRTTLASDGVGTGTPVRTLVCQQAGSITPLRWQQKIVRRGLAPTPLVRFQADVPAPSIILFDPDRGEVVTGDMTTVQGYYPLQDASGGALDWSGDSRDLTANGTITYGRDGVVGAAMLFNGTTGYLSRADTAFNYVSAFTVMGWGNPTTIGNVMGVIGKGAATVGWSLTVGTDGRMVFRVGNGSANLTATADDALLAGEWVFWYADFLGTNPATLRLFINNEIQAKFVHSTSFTPTTSANAFTLGGARDLSGGTLRYWDGSLCEVQTRTGILAPDQRKAAFEDGVPYIAGVQQEWQGQFGELNPRIAATGVVEVSAHHLTTAPTVRVLHSARQRSA